MLINDWECYDLANNAGRVAKSPDGEGELTRDDECVWATSDDMGLVPLAVMRFLVDSPELETELIRCAVEIEKMAEDPARGCGETVRLDGKAEGIRLALGKLREMVKR